MAVKVVLGIGSNLGDRLGYLNAAIKLLKEQKIIKNVKLSKIQETKALLDEDSPKEWDIDYLNIGICGTTNLNPKNLLVSIKNIERILGRKNDKHWAPRVIDVDILIYGDHIISDQNLTIPHSQLLKRVWVLNHLVELVPRWKYPLFGKYYMLSAQEIINLQNSNDLIIHQ